MPFETSPVSISELIAFLDGLLDPGASDATAIVHDFVDIPNPV
jgi:hypothetical protein